MSINLKAKETLIQVGDLKGTYRFVLVTEIYGKLSAAKVIKEAAPQRYQQRRDAGLLGRSRRSHQGVGH